MGILKVQCSECQTWMRRKARYCPNCGAPNPRKEGKCGNCGKSVSLAAQFCPYCRSSLRPESKETIAGGRWSRPDNAIAERFNIDDVKAVLQRGVIVETGTAAILLEGGALKDSLGPGRYNLDGILRRINHWWDPPPRTVILVDIGEIELGFDFQGLRTADDMEVDFSGEMVIQLLPDKEAHQAFVSNLFKGKGLGPSSGEGHGQLTEKEVEDRLRGAVKSAVVNECNASLIDDLVRDPERRVRIESAIGHAISSSLEAWGMQFLRMSDAEFGGQKYEELRKQAGEVEEMRRLYDFKRRVRDLARDQRLDEIKDEMERQRAETDLEEYIAQLAQEKGISDEKRDQEMRLLKLTHGEEIEKREAFFRMEQEMAELSHAMGYQELANKHRREQETLENLHAIAMDEARTDSERTTAAKDFNEKIRQGELGLKLKEERMAVKRRDLEAKAQLFQGRSVQDLIVLIEDQAVREDLLKLNTQAMQKGQSPEALLALAAPDSPGAAEALVRLLTLKGDEKEKEFSERKEMMDEFADRLERVLTKALETTAEAAKQPPPPGMMPPQGGYGGPMR